jgi:hypothetical protein
MDTWAKVGIITPYIIFILGALWYLIRGRKSRGDSDHELLIEIKKDVYDIKVQLQSDKGHLSHIDIEQDVHERWFAKVCEGIRNIKIYHRNYHKEDNYDLDLSRPDPLKI